MIPSRPPGASYLPALDGLRGFAAAIVLFSHFSNAFNLWDRLFGAGAGQHGVLLFFVLSGFLIAHLHLGQSAGP
ncbi:MAG: hypothetical protein RLZZ501_2002, partial [Pseudomonadota bacterium]